MNAHVRAALREAGAEAGRKARAEAGLPSKSKTLNVFSAWLSCWLRRLVAVSAA